MINESNAPTEGIETDDVDTKGDSGDKKSEKDAENKILKARENQSIKGMVNKRRIHGIRPCHQNMI